MKFWRKLKYWQIGAILGFIFGFLPLLGLLYNKFYHLNYVITNIPRYLSDKMFDCWFCDELLYTIAFLTLVQFTIIGALIGFVVGKLKKTSPSNSHE